MAAGFKGRREDQRLVTGAGRYTADWNLPGQLYAVFCRADRAHAVIRTVDTSAAARAPGVVAVFAGSDVADAGFHTLPPLAHFPGRGGMHLIVPERPVLAQGRVRYAGEEVAVVIAQTREEAADAAELIAVDYEDLPAVIGFDAALAAGATLVHDNIPGNMCFDFEYGDEAKTAAAIARADHVVAVSIDSPRVAPNTMETRGALASYDAATECYEIRCGHQGGPAMREALTVMLGVATDKVRVHMVDVGGAFGARTAPYAEHPLLLWIARRLGRPVKWISSRAEDFLTDNHGRAIRVAGELALDKAGRFLALRTNWLCDSGAYLSQAGVLTNSMNGLTMGAGAYRVDTLYGRHRQIMTNTAPTNAFRGAGRPEAALIVECLVDEAAVTLKVDPWELRRRNVIAKNEMPYKTRTGIGLRQRRFRRPHRSGRAAIPTGAAFPRGARRRRGAASCAASAAPSSSSPRVAAACPRTRSRCALTATGGSRSSTPRGRADRATRRSFPRWSATGWGSIPCASIAGPAIPMALS